MLKKVLKPLIFTVLSVLILNSIYVTLRPDIERWCDNFYSQKRNTVDVLFVGSSNVYSNIDPALLWEDSGIASYVLAGSAQPIWNTYYYLKEAYLTQHPSLVVIDMRTLAFFDDYQELSQAYQQTEGLKFPVNKIASILDSAPQKDMGAMLLGWPVIHTRWREGRKLNEEVENPEAMKMGFYPIHYNYIDEDIDFRPVFNEESTSVMTGKSEKFLRKSIELAQEKGSKVLLLKTPYIMEDYADGVFGQAEEIAAEYGVDALNMNRIDFGFEYVLELGDGEHLNDYGVERVCGYLGKYISENYDIPDRRGDKKYSKWQEYSELYDDTGFVIPLSDGAEEMLRIEDQRIAVNPGDGIYVLSYPLHIEDDTYYRIDVKLDSSEKGRLHIDLYGTGYDNAAQDEIIPLYGTDDLDRSLVINSGENVPEDASFRIFIGDSRQIDINIDSLVFSKLDIAR